MHDEMRGVFCAVGKKLEVNIVILFHGVDRHSQNILVSCSLLNVDVFFFLSYRAHFMNEIVPGQSRCDSELIHEYSNRRKVSARQLSKRKIIQFELVNNLTQQFYVSQGNMRFENFSCATHCSSREGGRRPVYIPLYFADAIRAFAAFGVSNLGRDLGFIR